MATRNALWTSTAIMHSLEMLEHTMVLPKDRKSYFRFLQKGLPRAA